MGNPLRWFKSKLLNFGNLSLGRQLSIISVVTLLLFLPVAVWLTLQPTRLFSRAYLPTTPPTEPGGATAMLSIDPELIFITPGQEVMLDVAIDAGTHEVTAADVILTFDKAIVSIEEVIPGDFLPVPLGKISIDNEMGKLQFAVGEQPSSIKKGGKGKLATLRVKSKGIIGSSIFEFGDGTMVAAVGWDTSVLLSTFPGVVEVIQQQGASVSILFKFQGVNTQRPGQVVSYTASSTKSEGDSFKGEAMAVSDANGQYRAVLSSVSPGTYDFTVTGPAHLSRFLGRHTIPSSGEYTIDISDKPLIAGDIAPPARDDRISIIDYSLMVTHFGPGYPDGGTPADLDFDGDVDIFDYNMIVSNFGKTGDLYAGGPNCPQVITPAKNPTTGECQEFSTPCDVPEGWEKVDSCPITSSTYYLQKEPAPSIFMPVSPPATGYAISALLKYVNGGIVVNQQGLTYSWSIDQPQGDSAIANITPFIACTNGIQPPCPNDHLTIQALNPGYANIRVKVVKDSTKATVAEATFYLNVLSQSLVYFNRLSPSGGETFEEGQVVTVKWNVIEGTYDYVDVYWYSYVGSELSSGFIGAEKYGVNDRQWDIPGALRGQRAKVVIQAVRDGIVVGQGISDDYFSVSPSVSTPTPTTDKPDLVITSLSIVDPPMRAENWTFFQGVVKNQGTAKYFGISNIYLIIHGGGSTNDRDTSCEVGLPLVDPGSSETFSLYCIAYKTGNLTATATVDYNNQVKESNESNNTYPISFYVSP